MYRGLSCWWCSQLCNAVMTGGGGKYRDSNWYELDILLNGEGFLVWPIHVMSMRTITVEAHSSGFIAPHIEF